MQSAQLPVYSRRQVIGAYVAEELLQRHVQEEARSPVSLVAGRQ